MIMNSIFHSKNKNSKKFNFIGIFLISIFFVSSILTLLKIASQSRMYLKQKDVDINSGRISNRFFIMWRLQYMYIEETSISKTLFQRNGGLMPTPDWQIVSSSSPWQQNSPHYAYHAAAKQMLDLELLFDRPVFDESFKATSAKYVLFLWRKDKNYHSAERYLIDLRDKIIELEKDRLKFKQNRVRTICSHTGKEAATGKGP